MVVSNLAKVITKKLLGVFTKQNMVKNLGGIFMRHTPPPNLVLPAYIRLALKKKVINIENL